MCSSICLSFSFPMPLKLVGIFQITVQLYSSVMSEFQVLLEDQVMYESKFLLLPLVT